MFGKNRVSPVAPRNPSQINEDVRIRGTITVSEPLVMAGQLDGDINADTLHVASTAIITGEISAQSITIDGRVLGSIVAGNVFYWQRRILKGSCPVRTLPLMTVQMLTQKFTKEPVTNG